MTRHKFRPKCGFTGALSFCVVPPVTDAVGSSLSICRSQRSNPEPGLSTLFPESDEKNIQPHDKKYFWPFEDFVNTSGSIGSKRLLRDYCDLLRHIFWINLYYFKIWLKNPSFLKFTCNDKTSDVPFCCGSNTHVVLKVNEVRF